MNELANAIVRQAPYFLELPVGIEYPKTVTEAAQIADLAFSKWVDADTNLSLAEVELASAETGFAKIVKEAAASGKPMPKKTSLDELETSVMYCTEVERIARHEVSLKVEELEKAISANRVEIAIKSVEIAEAGMETYKTEISRIAEQLPEIEKNRRAAYRGLVLLQHFTKPELSYVADFGAGDDVRLPSTGEPHARSVIAALKGFIEFASSSHVETVEAEQL